MIDKKFRGDELAGLSSGLGGGGSSFAGEVILVFLAVIALLLCLETCEIKVRIVSEPAKAEERRPQQN